MIERLWLTWGDIVFAAVAAVSLICLLKGWYESSSLVEMIYFGWLRTVPILLPVGFALPFLVPHRRPRWLKGILLYGSALGISNLASYLCLGSERMDGHGHDPQVAEQGCGRGTFSGSAGTGVAEASHF